MTNNPTDDSRPWSVFLIFLRLGLTSFGGPIALYLQRVSYSSACFHRRCLFPKNNDVFRGA
ncbi:hypothetical protein CF312_29425 [Klebsiella pneumoniae]|nr:hypothetical protein [Klebsiella pneumoniae]